MNSADMEKLAKMAAKEAVSETFLSLGINISNSISVQGQFAFLRNLHYAARHARNVVIAGVLGMIGAAPAGRSGRASRPAPRRRLQPFPRRAAPGNPEEEEN